MNPDHVLASLQNLQQLCYSCASVDGDADVQDGGQDDRGAGPGTGRAHLHPLHRAHHHRPDQAEFGPLVHCTGVAIPDSTGQLGAAISLTTVRAAADQPAVDNPLHRMREAVNAIATALGRPLS